MELKSEPNTGAGATQLAAGHNWPPSQLAARHNWPRVTTGRRHNWPPSQLAAVTTGRRASIVKILQYLFLYAHVLMYFAGIVIVSCLKCEKHFVRRSLT